MPSAQPAPRRRLSTHERRAAILAAARRCFAAAPYGEVSAADVATASGSSAPLVFHYFGSKAQLYAEVVRAQAQELADRQAAALEALPPGVPVRDRVRAMVLVRLDEVAGPTAPAGEEPAQARAVRRQAREAQVEALRALLPGSGWARHDYAVRGWFGLLDEVCEAWAEAGRPEADRHAVVDAALGALEGALGDWRA